MKLPLLAVILMPLISLVPAFPHQDKTQVKRKNALRDAIDTSETGGHSVEFAGTAKDPKALREQVPHLKTALKLALPKSYGNQWNKSLYQPSDVRSLRKKDYEHTENLNGKRNGLMDVNGNKRNPAVVAGAKALLSNPKVQEAVVEKGIEVAGRLVDKQLQIIDDAQQKAADFLKKEIKLDIMPDKGWENEDMFVPPGYHIDAAVEGGETSPKEEGQVPYVFPSGVGGVLMNGCWGTDYKPNDPCYNSKATSTICSNMIDGAAFLGVGFDGRGKYSPESRKMSIVQRNCANKATYDDLDVPDTMNVHGIYDTSASLITFESREEYSKFIQQEAGISGSYFGFSAGVKEAWGESTQSSSQKYMAVLDVDVDRYEIFMDEVKPNDLSLSFLREFMALPTSYFAAGAPLRYQNYIQRWGTHFIKSSKFGGQLEIRKTMDAQDARSKKEFEIQMELEFKTLFASVGAKAAAQENEAARKQTKTTSTSVLAQGGSQEIASILSDVYSPTFKTEFKEWLRTIPAYPKAFRFQMGSITELLNFRANDLFSEEKVNWGCEGNVANLLTEEKDGKTVKYYEVVGLDGAKTKYYCDFDSRQALEDALQLRRNSLQRAIEIYMEEGPISISNIQLDQCTRETEEGDFSPVHITPSWKQITKGNSVFRVSFDMVDDLRSSIRKALDIERNASLLVRFSDKKWRTSDRLGKFHLYSDFDNGQSGDVSRRKMSILGLVLTFNEADGTLILSPQDYKASKTFFPTLGEELTGIQFARVQSSHQRGVKRQEIPDDTPLEPCKVDWSNALRLDPTDRNGKCLHFTASTEGTIFVVFAALPRDDATWYTVQISPTVVATYKGKTLKTKTSNVNARALGDASLYQSYFVCITETERSTLIEYGKSLGTSDSGDVYLNLIDSEDHLNVRFYAFGNDEKAAKVMDAHLVPRALTRAECKGDTVRDRELDICVQNCHKDCDPYAGCKEINNPAVPDGCYACRVALDTSTNNCIPECPAHKTLTSDKTCVSTFDVLLKPAADFGPLEIDDIPTLYELTICVWLRLEGTWGDNTLNNVFLVRYRHQAGIVTENFFDTRIEGSYINDGGIDFFFTVPRSGSYRLEVNELNDGNWHQICVSWSGLSGVAIYYKTGKRVLSATYRRSELRGGGKLMIGGMIGGGSDKRQVTIHTTGVNLWNRVLSDQEIANNAERCDGGEGNEKPWHSWYDVAQANSGFLQDTSQCQAPTPAAD